jgi:hypothetical protein
MMSKQHVGLNKRICSDDKAADIETLVFREGFARIYLCGRGAG